MKQFRARSIVVGFIVTMFVLTLVSHAQFQAQRGGIDPRNPPAAQPVAVVSNDPPPLETDMVLLTVSVAAPENRQLPSLPRESFEVLEDGVPQKIAYFWQDSRPISV